MEEAKLIKAIEHYQKNLERYLAKCEDAKILHCIERLSSLPIEVTHLQKTGVGRTVNGLRKLGNEVGEAARTLVTKWKDMVAQDGDESEAQEKQNSSHSSEDYSENDSQSSRCEQDDDTSRRLEKEKSRKHDKKRYDDKKRDGSKRRRDDKEESKRRELEESKRKEELKRRDEKEEMRRREEKVEEEMKRREEKEEMKRKEDKEQLEQRRKEEKDEKRRRDEKEESRRKADDSSKNGNKRKRDEDMNGHMKHKKSSDDSSKTSKSTSSSASSSNKHKRSSEESNHKSRDEKKRKSSSSDKKEKESSSNSSAKKKVVAADDGIDCESGTSFADALMMHSPSVKVSSSKKSLSSSSFTSSTSISATKSCSVQKSTSRLEPAPSIAFPIAPLPEKLETQDISIATMLPSITTNYKPLGNTFREFDLNSKARKVQDDEALSRLMYAKNQRTKVYSGNKAAFSKMPTLFELCTRILQDNIEALEYTGGVPYAILKPVLEKATPDQLFTLEYHNPYIIDDSDELWSFHCQKEFRGKKRQEMETCRDMYMRCLNERETKLKALTANIKLSQDKSLPVRQTKLAYVDSVVKPPRNVAKKQARNGVDNNKKPMITPSSRLNAIATAGAAGHVSVPNHVTERSSSSASSSYSKPQKKAPLMAKTLQLMKGRFRR